MTGTQAFRPAETGAPGVPGASIGLLRMAWVARE
ncbi:Uncharacterised protein [Bordetella pertussis]|nr:Uncharacterised protein [Bordetella pertussis]